MSNQNFKKPKEVVQTQPTTEVEEKDVVVLGANEAEPENLGDKIVGWISPLDVNYKELIEILDGSDLVEYIGDNLPEEEVKRIKEDYEIYLKNK